MNDIKEFIIDYLQREYTIEVEDIMSLNFVETGYVDSFGLLTFILSLEQEYGIEFSEEELQDPSFKVVGSLIETVAKKIAEL
jgi:acyl carrier protein